MQEIFSPSLTYYKNLYPSYGHIQKDELSREAKV